MPFILLLMFAVAVFAEEKMPQGLLEGELLEWDGTPGAGAIVMRDDDNRVYRCSFDAKTYMEAGKEHAPITSLRPGDRLEVLADRDASSNACYIRMVHLMPPKPIGLRQRPYRTPLRKSTLSSLNYQFESLYPRGNLTFSGVVVRINPERLILRTNGDARETIYLRDDTRYSRAGLKVNSSELRVNSRVFVRAGRNFDDQIEAYQVVWGEILQPR